MIKKLVLFVYALALCLTAAADDYYLLQTRVEQGDAAAQYDLGWYYANLSSPDEEKAWHWWSESASNGNLAANHLLGHVYRVGFLQFDKKIEQDSMVTVRQSFSAVPADGDISMAIFHYKWCAMSDAYGDAQYWLGKWYYDGEVVARDFDQAFRYISRAAENDELDKEMRLEMMRRLATCYRNGQGITADALMADKWLQNADWLENGCYGFMYDEFGVPCKPADRFDIILFNKKSDEGKSKREMILSMFELDGSGRFKLPYSLIDEVLVYEKDGYERIEFKFEPGIKLYLKMEK